MRPPTEVQWSLATLVYVVQRQLRPELDRRDHSTGQHAPVTTQLITKVVVVAMTRQDVVFIALLAESAAALSLLSGLRCCLHLITYRLGVLSSNSIFLCRDMLHYRIINTIIQR